MADFSLIARHRLATGAAINGPADVDQLLAAGVRAIIDCRAEFDDGPELAQSGVNYLWNPTADDGQPKPPEWFGRSATFAVGFLRHQRGLLYAHCAAGKNRGPSTCYFLLRWYYRLTPGLAESLVRQARPQVELRYKADADAAITSLAPRR